MTSKPRRPGTAHVTRAGMRLLAAHPTESVWRVFVALAQYMDHRLQMAPGHRQVADDVGRTERTVRRAVEYLVDAEVLVIVHRGNRHRAACYSIGPALQARLRPNGRGSTPEICVSAKGSPTPDIQVSAARPSTPDIGAVYTGHRGRLHRTS